MGIYTDGKTGRLFVQFNYQGQTYKFRQPRGVTRKQAEKFETKKKSELFFEAHGVSKRNETLYEQFVAETYLPFIKANRCKNTYNQAGIVCRSSLQFLKGRSFRSIKPADIEKFKSYRMGLPTIHGKTRSPSTIAKEISHISAVFTMAIKNDLCDYNPCSRIELPQFDNVQDRILAEEHEELLFTNMHSEWARDICRLVLHTGLRQNDVMNLSRFKIDRDAGVIRLVQGKTKQKVEIPMNDTVLEIVDRRLRENETLLFPSPKTGKIGSSVRSALIRACTRAELPKVTIRDLRRTFGTRLHEEGWDDMTVAGLLGHRDLRSIHRYKRGTEIKRRAVQSLEKAADPTVRNDMKKAVGSAGS